MGYVYVRGRYVATCSSVGIRGQNDMPAARCSSRLLEECQYIYQESVAVRVCNSHNIVSTNYPMSAVCQLRQSVVNYFEQVHYRYMY